MRRARRPLLSKEVNEFFAQTATLSIEQSLWSFFACARTFNDPFAEDRACHKPNQLHAAAMAGLRIPRTLVTSERHKATAFVKLLEGEGKQTVYKLVSTSQHLGAPTRLFLEEDFERLDSLAYCPTVFQERIVGGSDLRVAVVEKQVFPARWGPAGGPTQFADVRADHSARMQACSFPEEYLRPLLNLHASLGIRIGIYDFKLDQAGIPYFLEVNPSGQWLDLELQARHPISSAIARMLTGNTENHKDWSAFVEEELAEIAPPSPLQTIPTKWLTRRSSDDDMSG